MCNWLVCLRIFGKESYVRVCYFGLFWWFGYFGGD